MCACVHGVNMAMKNFQKFILPVLKAQVAIPIVFLIWWGRIFIFHEFNDMTSEMLNLVGMIILWSGVALVISLPTSVILGIPLLLVLDRYDALNIYIILLVAIALSFVGALVMSEMGLVMFTLPIGILGGLICWNELRKKSILTSQENTPTARTRNMRARS